MRSKLSKIAVVGAALAATTVGLISTGPALAGPPLGTNTLAPGTGTAATAFSMNPPAGSSCTGSGSGVPAYRWQTYFVSAAVDASTLTYAAGPNPVAGQFVSPLYDSAGGTAVINRNPASSPLGLISGIPTFSLSSLVGQAGLVNGGYKMGIACTQAGALDAGKFWEVGIVLSNVTAAGFNYVTGALPGAPTLSALTSTSGQLAGTLTAGTAGSTATTGYTITATSPGQTTVTLTPATAGPFTLTGLVNGNVYTVSAIATNSLGDSVPSSPAQTGTPNQPAFAPVTGFTAAGAVGSVVLSWTAPAGDSGRTGYTISSPTAPGAPFTAAAAATTLTVTGLTAGTSYSFSIIATYPAGFTGTSAGPVSASAFGSAVVVQNISVNRPVGALVLTQRCGVQGPLPDASDFVFGSMPALGAFPASATGTNAYGNNPGVAEPTLGVGGINDPLYGQYPYPVDAAGIPNPNYPTNCGLNLGIGKLILTGPRAGQYFTAPGRMSQVTVVDTRDTNTLWTVNGTMSNFVTGGGTGNQTFLGDYMGWNPSVTDDSDVTLAGYDQTVTAGAAVEPWNAPGNTIAAGSGLGAPRTLASAAAGSGLGIATLDARLKLIIPLTALNGTYTATLSLSAL